MRVIVVITLLNIVRSGLVSKYIIDIDGTICKEVGEVIGREPYMDRIEKINSLISKFELDSIRDIKGKFISGGQKKKLVIAIALISEPGFRN